VAERSDRAADHPEDRFAEPARPLPEIGEHLPDRDAVRHLFLGDLPDLFDLRRIVKRAPVPLVREKCRELPRMGLLQDGDEIG
jgi:hypothetical protein